MGLQHHNYMYPTSLNASLRRCDGRCSKQESSLDTNSEIWEPERFVQGMFHKSLNTGWIDFEGSETWEFSNEEFFKFARISCEESLWPLI